MIRGGGVSRLLVLLGFGLCPGLPALADQRPKEPADLVRVPPDREQRKVRAEFGGAFRLYLTDHFHFVSDTSPRYHRTVAGVLEQFYQEVHPRFFKKSMKPVRAYLIHGGRDFEEFVTRRGHGQSASSFGFYDRRERALYARRYFPDGRPSGVGTLFHEVIHAMIHADFKSPPPTWFEEGFASLFEHGRIVRGQWIYGNPNPWRDAEYHDAFEAGNVPSLKEYMNLSSAAFRANSNVNYNTGRSLCLYLLNLGEEKLVRFVAEIRRRRKGVTALKRATGVKKLKALEKAWRASVRKVNFGGWYVHRAEKGGGLAVLREGLKHHPDYGYLRLRLAEACQKAGRGQEALEHARAALRDPHFIFPAFAYAIIGSALWTRDADAAVEAFRQALRYQPWMENVLEATPKNLAILLRRRGRRAEAEAVLAALEKLKEDDRRPDG